MPAQSTTVATAFYEVGDTYPPLRRQLLDEAGNPIDLGVTPNVAQVFINIAYSSYSYYYSPQRKLVDDGVCIVEDQAVPASLGWVQWEPQAGDLDIPGSHSYRFRIVWPSGAVQTIPANTYEIINVTSPVGGIE